MGARTSSKEVSPSLSSPALHSSCAARLYQHRSSESSTKHRSCSTVKSDMDMDLPRLIWQLERHHASDNVRMQAEMRSLWEEFSTFRENLNVNTQRAMVSKPSGRH